jgi:DNA-binding NarL/FixJ family response regulator
MERPIKIFIVDDHRVISDGLKLILESKQGYQVLNAFTNPVSLLQELKVQQPDLIITDITMPGMNGLELSKQVLANYPKIKILMLTMHIQGEYVKSAIKAGVSGYVLKDSSPEDLFNAIEAVMSGNKFISPKAQNGFFDLGRPKSELTARESEVLQALAMGMNTREVADKLFISNHTVETHRKNLLSKTESKNIAELIVWGVSRGYIFPQP